MKFIKIMTLLALLGEAQGRLEGGPREALARPRGGRRGGPGRAQGDPGECPGSAGGDPGKAPGRLQESPKMTGFFIIILQYWFFIRSE